MIPGLGWLRRRSRWFRWLFVGTGAFLVLVTGYMAVTFAQVWSASRHDEATPAGAIVVMGAAQYDGVPSPVFEARLEHAIDLYEADVAPVVVVTGGRQEGDRFTEAGAGSLWLQEHGVPDEALRLEVQGRNSWESLAASARFLDDEGIDDMVIVSDGYHAYRLVAIAGDLGVDAHVSPTESSPVSGPSELRALLRETAAVSVGRIVGYRRLMDLDDRVGDVREASEGVG